MGIDEVVQIVNRGLYTICVTAAPILLVSLIVGLAISIFQTVTSIQEQTLTFVPKILSIFIALIFLGHWMINNMVEYMVGLWSDFAIYIR
ncbi:MAG: flagellar biosynthesis protein FliQ [Lachnospiraceae bacterium]|nr:flagellar biosynthesis protein FliQ [Lachnospiraceae bacterium]MDD7026912.1 flagellar biosynthesis protein FliQ [Lachnospiraceae bacterium]MDY5701025.1 flagellar biosynthesis protein FliQ [Lachnospiraceae bacterium]